MSVALELAPAVLIAQIAFGQLTTTLKPQTSEEFDRYCQAAESKMTHQPRYPELPAGQVRVEAVAGDGSTEISSGLVHDWVGATVVANARVSQVIAVLQNYAAYKKTYAPEVMDSRLIARDGNRFHIYLRIIKKKVLTAVMNTEHDVDYRDLGDGLWSVVSRSTRIAEVENDHELPAGTGHGFLWRLNAYWLVQQRGPDVYLECRSVSLSRDIPAGARFLVRPFVTSLPVESLKATLLQTVKAL